LFGAPPGYVGFEEGGQLTERVRRKPFSVVLFDEIEKAHPDIFNSLLQVLEEGRLTDGQGRVIDFKNTVIIMTTNLGTKDITGGPVGFTLQGDSEQSYKAMRSKVIEELKKHFKPEFLNRVDETIVFPQLSQDELLQIVDLFVRRLRERMLDRDMTLDVTDAARRQLLTIGWDPMLGARPLRRAIQHEVEDMLSEKILNGELSVGQHVLVDFADDEFTAVMTGSILPTEEPVSRRPSKSARVPADSEPEATATDPGEDAPSE
jgi:ATP-dependent Clp protease ATP-binding subunit ClpC